MTPVDDLAAGDDVSRFSPPPLPPGGSITVQVAFQDGEAYAAPLGSSMADPDAWIRIDSLESLAERVGVDLGEASA